MVITRGVRVSFRPIKILRGDVVDGQASDRILRGPQSAFGYITRKNL